MRLKTLLSINNENSNAYNDIEKQFLNLIILSRHSNSITHAKIPAADIRSSITNNMKHQQTKDNHNCR
jgi:hypothetical protein